MYLRDQIVGGYRVAQHHDPRFELDVKRKEYGARLVRQETGPLKRWQIDEDSVGPWHNESLWRTGSGTTTPSTVGVRQADGSTREVPATTTGDHSPQSGKLPGWSNAWPATITGLADGERAKDDPGPTVTPRTATPGGGVRPGARTPSATAPSRRAVPTGSSAQPAPTNRSGGSGQIPSNSTPTESSFGRQTSHKEEASIEAMAAQPIRRDDYGPDGRWQQRQHVAHDYLPKWPIGSIGISMAGTEENDQHDLWHPTDGRLFAPQYRGRDAFGTLVCDLDPEDTISKERRARLQTAWRVVMHDEYDSGLDNKAGPGIAWHLDLTSQGDQLGMGAVILRGQGSAAGPMHARAAPPATFHRPARGARPGSTMSWEGGLTGAFSSYQAGGPWTPGSRNDKHNHGEDEDGHRWNSVHLSTDTIFYRNREEDAPIEFSVEPWPIPEPSDYDYPHHVYLSYDPRRNHRWMRKEIEGLWRFWGTNPYVDSGRRPPTREPTDPPVTPPPTDEPTDPPTGGGPGDFEPPDDPTTTPQGPGQPTPDLGGGGDFGGRPGGGGGDGGGEIPAPGPGGEPGGGGGGESEGGGGGGRGRAWPPRAGAGDPIPGVPFGFDPTTPGFNKVNVSNGFDHSAPVAERSAFFPGIVGLAAIVMRPQSTNPGSVDYRKGSAGTSHADDSTRPGVMRMDAWGHEANGEWTYNQKPGYSRVPGGTSSGGVSFGDPETSVDDRAAGEDGDMTPPGVTKSTSYWNAKPGAWHSAGVPDPSTGDLENCAFRWGRNSDGEFVVEGRASDAWSPVLRATKTELFLAAPSTAPADGDVDNNEVAFYVTDAGDTLHAKAKDGDGDVIDVQVGGGGGASDHGALTGLSDDDHSQYALLAGRSGGQHLNGGTAAAEELILQGTTHGDGGPVKIENGILLFDSPDVSSSTTIDIQDEGNIPWITGTTTIQTISNGTRGAILHLFFASSGCRVKGDGTGNILLPESLDYISQANEVLSLIHDNSYWRALGPLPAAGEIEMSAVDDMPGFLECDGSAVSRTTYARLFDAIGTTWGTGDGSTTFNLPDLRDQFMKGIASSGESIGDTGGSKNITPAGTLSSDATGVTNNGVATIGAAGGAARAGAGAVPAVAGDPVTPDTINDPMHTHSFTGTQHSNEPQHTVLRHFIRY